MISVTQGGYTVDPTQLNKFASYLNDTAHSEINDAASGVQSANGFDNAAFGIFAAQLLAVPARIAMAVAVTNLNKLAGEISDAGRLTTTTASNYQQNEQNNAGAFTDIHEDLTS
jgi:hypothetical protein